MGFGLRRVAASVVALTVASGTVAVVGELGTAGSAEAAQRVRVVQAIRALDVKSETPVGYDRAKFRHWVDANGDGQDTRAEVLIQESKVAVSLSGGTVRTGKWRSYYDGQTWRQASDVDIDHLVPLKEAWDSGAKRWNADTRKRFANDLRDRRSLVAVTDNVNQAKGADDPAQWMPVRGKCRYTKEWVAVKSRWDLSVNRAEKRTLIRQAKRCGNPRITIKRAKVVTGSGGGSTGGGTGSNPYQDRANRPVSSTNPDLDCGDIPSRYKPVRIFGTDYHRLDADGDGWGCES
jgi:hypothetical protein